MNAEPDVRKIPEIERDTALIEERIKKIDFESAKRERRWVSLAGIAGILSTGFSAYFAVSSQRAESRVESISRALERPAAIRRWEPPSDSRLSEAPTKIKFNKDVLAELSQSPSSTIPYDDNRGEFTIQVAGMYLVSAGVYIAGTSTRRLELQRNEGINDPNNKADHNLILSLTTLPESDGLQNASVVTGATVLYLHSGDRLCIGAGGGANAELKQSPVTNFVSISLVNSADRTLAAQHSPWYWPF